MQMSELRKVFSSLEHLLGQSQANKSTLADLARLNEALATFDDWTVAQFCRQLEQIGEGKPQRQAKANEANAALVEDAVTTLMDARGDRVGVAAALTKLESDKRLRLVEWNAMAQRIVGGTSRYRTKADALREIKLRLEAHIAANRRLEASSDIF